MYFKWSGLNDRNQGKGSPNWLNLRVMNMQPKDGGIMSQEERKKEKMGRKKGTDLREDTNVPNVLEAESKGVSH